VKCRIWKYTSCTQPAGQRNESELIPTVQMESQHSIGWPTCHDFPRFLIISEKSRPEVWSCWRRSPKKCLFGKKFPYGQIFQNVFWKYSCGHRTTSSVQISWNLADWKSANWCVIYRTKKTSVRSPALASARIAPKSARASSRIYNIQYTVSTPNFSQIRILPVEL